MPLVYNKAFNEAQKDPAVLVFIHDDVHLTDFYWPRHLHAALETFDVVGLAGNKRCVPGQVSWMYVNEDFERDAFDNLCGAIGHGPGFPDLVEMSVYGETKAAVKLLDGVFMAAKHRVGRQPDAIRRALPFSFLRHGFLPTGRTGKSAYGRLADIHHSFECGEAGREAVV